jgi:predicted unusual protein kinase regulating ubiquinone biosynthesis (AarF/ABC1/UbiB family)
MRDALVDLSTSQDAVDLEGLERALARFLAQRLGPGMAPGADILNDLLAVVVRYGLALDPQLAGVFRALATLEGTLQLIDPTFSGGGPQLFGTQLDVLLGYGGLIAATMLGLRVIVAVSRDPG